MVKRIVVGTLFLGFVAVLVLGAVNRTTDRAEAERNVGLELAHQNGRGATEQTLRSERQGAGLGLSSSGGQEGNTGSQGRWGAEGGLGDREGTGQADATSWVMLEGTVMAVDEQGMHISLTDGNELLVQGRAWRFVQENGMLVQPGDTLTLSGFYEGGTFEVGEVENLTEGDILSLRAENGRPLWAGQGGQGFRGGAG